MNGHPNHPAGTFEGAPLATTSHLARRALLRYSTFTKMLNVAACELDKRLAVTKPRSRPYRAIIDVANICPLRCPYCPTGTRQYGRKPGLLPIRKVQELLDHCERYLYLAILYNWGEPFINPAIPEMVALVHERKIQTVISTNLNVTDPGIVEASFDAGLDHLIVSIDGATQEVYQQYRVAGDLSRVLDNLRRLVAYKRKTSRHDPTIEWQFLIFDHNRHEVDAARRLASAVGVDIFRATPGFVPSRPLEAWRGMSSCSFLWDTVTMQADGSVGACCHHIDKADDFAELPAASFNQAWHAERFLTARRLFSRRAAKTLPAGLSHPCLNCPLVHQRPYLQQLLPADREPAGTRRGTPTNCVCSGGTDAY